MEKKSFACDYEIVYYEIEVYARRTNERRIFRLKTEEEFIYTIRNIKRENTKLGGALEIMKCYKVERLVDFTEN